MANFIHNLVNWLQSILDFWGDFFSGLWDGTVDLITGLLGGLGDYIASWFESLGLSITIPPNIYMILDDITKSIGYVVPFNQLMPIVAVWLGFYGFKIVFAIYNVIASTVVRRTKIKV